MAKNGNLHKAKEQKNDEFYTQYEDIEKELNHYEKHFKGKTVFMNCDDPTWSNFWKYFHLNFEYLGLKKIISTHYEYGETSTYKLEYTGGNDEDFEYGVKTDLSQNGDFRSPECIELLKQADIVVTNPPFSLFREYVAQLMEYNKKFIILSNLNAITYKEFFPLLKDNKVWVGNGFNLSMVFKTLYPNTLESNRKYVLSKGYNPDDGYVKTPAISWFTNLDIAKRHNFIDTTYFYSKKDQLYPDLYPKYDNYDAINVDKVSQIPMDYNGIMGVPITFFDVYNPDQFKIIGVSSKDNCGDVPRLHDNAYYNGYTRGKVITRVESNMPLLLGNVTGGTKCSKEGYPDIYQLYWRLFIKRKE